MTEGTIARDIKGRNHKDGTRPFLIELLPKGAPATGSADLSFEDKDGDGVVIIDVKRSGSDWKINNADVVIVGDDQVTAIIRVRDGSNMLIDNSSIQRCEGSPAVLFAVGVDESNGSGNTIMGGGNAGLNNVVCWEVANGSGDAGSNNIDCQNCHGCSQFVADIVIHSSTSGFNRCHFSLPVRTTSSLFFLEFVCTCTPTIL